MSTDLALLPATWETVRLSINDVTLDEVALLTALYNTCSYAEPWDPTFHKAARIGRYHDNQITND
jgi:hypothetical protein